MNYNITTSFKKFIFQKIYFKCFVVLLPINQKKRISKFTKLKKLFLVRIQTKNVWQSGPKSFI